MYRTAINSFISWKLREKKKPLVFLGARQVGKTWLIKEFGRTEFRQMFCEKFQPQTATRSSLAKRIFIWNMI